MIYKSIFSSPLGYLEICADAGEAVTRLYFTSTPSEQYTESEITRQAARELEEYFSGQRQQFNFALAPEGSAFEQQVWQACCDIGYGKTATFQDLAAAIGDAKSAKKVGQAVEANPIAIAIPTHRVIGKTSLLASFSTEAAQKEAPRGAEKQFLNK